MIVTKIPFDKAGIFSPLFMDYIQQKTQLKPYYRYAPEITSFKQAIEERTFAQDKREVLVKSITSQYKGVPACRAVMDNISLLEKDNTFTVTTGHQLNIFTGPLYFIYKIVSTINLARKLKSAYPSYNFVPLFWMATEDHDLEEIKSVHVFGNNYSWETNQTGAVGRMKPEGLAEMMSSMPEKLSLFEDAYRQADTLADAVRLYVNELFGQEGLVVLDADQPELKRQFIEVISDDLINHKANDLAGRAAEHLISMGYKPQVYPRSINFFYMDQGVRERIVREGDHYIVRNTNLSFSAEEIIRLLEEHPERFSPNVVMRPLYQETILPNLAYLGGPAEVAYWLQIKAVFDKYETFYPVLMPRNFATIIQKGAADKMKKLALAHTDIYEPKDKLKDRVIQEMGALEVDFEHERYQLTELYESLKNKAILVDASLEGAIEAEKARQLKSLDNLEKRVQKAEENKHKVSIGQFENVYDKLFPGGSPQERVDNVMSYCINHDRFFNDLFDTFNPFDYQINVIAYP